MAKPSLAQSCPPLYEIQPIDLSKIDMKLVYASALTHIIFFWFENSHDQTSFEGVEHIKEIVLLLGDLLDDAKVLLPKP